MFSATGFWVAIGASLMLAVVGRFLLQVNFGRSGQASASERVTAYVCFSAAAGLAGLAYVAASVAF